MQAGLPGIDAEPAAPWKVSPSILEASINA
jgi:hypothetical protein